MADAVAPLPAEYLADPNRYFLEWIPQKIEEQRDLGERFSKSKRRDIAQIHLTGERGGHWHFVLDKGSVYVVGGLHDRPSFTVTMAVDTWRGLRMGELNGLKELLKGRIKITGSKLALLRVGKLFK